MARTEILPTIGPLWNQTNWPRSCVVYETSKRLLGDGEKRPALEEANTAAVARRSLVAARYIPAGTVMTEESIVILRPGTGLPPTMRPQLIGRRVRRDIEPGTPLSLDMMT
jgi:sialic acid synthase SpsE